MIDVLNEWTHNALNYHCIKYLYAQGKQYNYWRRGIIVSLYLAGLLTAICLCLMIARIL